MAKHSKYLRHEITCPEKDEKAVLLSEWHTENDQEILNGIRCDNVKLRDLSGTDCHWSCWEVISREKS
jgi:hypothetical protein